MSRKRPTRSPEEPSSRAGPRITAWLGGFAHRAPVLSIMLGVFLYSTNPVLVQASDLDGDVFSFWRLTLAIPATALMSGAFRLSSSHPMRRRGRYPAGAWRAIAVAGVGLGLNQLLLMMAVKATSVTDVTLIGTLAPVFTGVAAAFVFKERLRLVYWLWSLLAIVGAGIVVLAGARGPEGDPAGMAMAFASVLALVVFLLAMKEGRAHLPFLPFLFRVTVIAAGTVALYVLVTGIPVLPLPQRDLVLVIGVILGAGTTGHLFIALPLRWVPASLPPVVRLMQPIYAGVLAWAFLGEAIHTAHFVGGAITLGSVCGAVVHGSRPPASPPHRPRPTSRPGPAGSASQQAPDDRPETVWIPDAEEDSREH